MNIVNDNLILPFLKSVLIEIHSDKFVNLQPKKIYLNFLYFTFLYLLFFKNTSIANVASSLWYGSERGKNK